MRFSLQSKGISRLLGAAALAVTLLPAIPADAQQRGGGSRGGGRQGGGGHQGGGGTHRDGSGSGGGHRYGGGQRHGGGGYRYGGSHRWGGGYRYRPYRYSSFYRPYWSLGWGWGWPYYSYYGYGLYSPWNSYYGYYGAGYGGYGGGRFAVVDTDIAPEEAEVHLNGQYIGTADDFDGHPDYLYLEPGKYRLEFRAPGYRPMSLEVSVRRGEQVPLKRSLAREPGHSKLSFDKHGQTGMPHGRVFSSEGKPVTAERRRHERDRYTRHHDDDDDDNRVEILDDDDMDDDADGSDGRLEERREVTREEIRIETRDEPKKADRSRMKFKVTPEDAAVYLDDRYLGAAEELAGSRGISADAGRHTVTVVRPGYKTKTVEVELEGGKALDIVVDLEK